MTGVGGRLQTAQSAAVRVAVTQGAMRERTVQEELNELVLHILTPILVMD